MYKGGDGIKEQHQVNKELIPLARALNLPLVATNDVHYCAEADAAAQDILVCVQTNTTINDAKRLKSDTNQLYFKSAVEMERIFGVSYPTIKSRLNRIGGQLDFVDVDPAPNGADVIERLRQGEITAEQALAELEGPR